MAKQSKSGSKPKKSRKPTRYNKAFGAGMRKYKDTTKAHAYARATVGVKGKSKKGGKRASKKGSKKSGKHGARRGRKHTFKSVRESFKKALTKEARHLGIKKGNARAWVARKLKDIDGDLSMARASVKELAKSKQAGAELAAAAKIAKKWGATLTTPDALKAFVADAERTGRSKAHYEQAVEAEQEALKGGRPVGVEMGPENVYYGG